MPPGLHTDTWPEAPAASMAVMVLAFTTEYETDAVPPKLTAVAAVKLLPLMVMREPGVAEVGVKEVMTGRGGGMKVNPGRLAVPSGVLTDTRPEDPPATTAVMVF